MPVSPIRGSRAERALGSAEKTSIKPGAGRSHCRGLEQVRPSRPPTYHDVQCNVSFEDVNPSSWSGSKGQSKVSHDILDADARDGVLVLVLVHGHM